MLPKDRIAAELKKAKGIWKDLVNNHKSEDVKLAEVLHRYKSFLEENKTLIRREWTLNKDIALVEEKLNHLCELSDRREKKILLNDAYVGLVFDISESIDDLKSRMEEEAYSASELAILN